MRYAGVIVLVSVLTGVPGLAVTLHVPADYSSIQAALDAANSGDRVLVADGTYTGQDNKNLNFGGKAVELVSEGGPEACIIDCEHNYRGFLFDQSEGPDSIVDGFTVINARFPDSGGPAWGGGVLCQGASPTIRNCVFSDAWMLWTPPGPYSSGVYGGGGGITCTDGAAPRIEFCTIRDNVGGAGGGGMWIENSSPVIIDCVIEDNLAYSTGGGIYLEAGLLTLERCVIRGNSCRNGSGGGVYLKEANGRITQCEFVDNHAEYCGGAVYCSDSAPVIGGAELAANQFTGNTAGAGSDLASGETPDPPVNATYNRFSGCHESDYYISPLTAFDLSGCSSETVLLDQDVYVSPSGDDTADGLTAQTAFRTIQHAMSRILPTEAQPLTIHLSPGEFSSEISGEIYPLPLLSHLTLSGSGSGITILDADHDSCVIYGINDHGVCIDNLSVLKGSNSVGGGIHAEDCSVTVQGCDIGRSVANNGGGGYFRDCTLNISRCSIFGNYTRSYGNGGGLYTVDTDLTMQRCTVFDNRSESDGAGMRTGGVTFLRDCVIRDNSTSGYQSDAGGGIYGSGETTLTTCMILGNYSQMGAGVAGTGQWVLLNCLLAGNTSSNYGSSVYMREAEFSMMVCTSAMNACQYTSNECAEYFLDSTAGIYNSILWNDADAEILLDGDSEITAENDCIAGGYSGVSILDDDPLLCQGPLHSAYLSQVAAGQDQDSPCVNAGGHDVDTFAYDPYGNPLDLGEGSTRTDWGNDRDIVDLGFHVMPEDDIGVTLEMPGYSFREGDPCYLKVWVRMTPDQADRMFKLFVLLELGGSYWAAPSWVSLNQELDYYALKFPAGISSIDTIPVFTWPDVNPLHGACFISALTDLTVSEIVGSFDMLHFQWQ